MFAELSQNDMIKGLKTRTITGLDLSVPNTTYIFEEPPLAQWLGELDVRLVYDRFVRQVISSLDLAGLEKYHFRKTRVNALLKAVTNDYKVKLLDAADLVVFDVNPNVFFPIFPSNLDPRSDLPNFHQFGRLPVELRHKIWELAAEPRHLVATENISHRWVNRLAPWIPESDFRIDVIRTSVTEASSEARTLLVNLGVYKVVRYQYRRSRIVEYFIFNPETDTLEVDSLLPGHGFPPRSILGGPTMNPALHPDLLVVTSLTLKLDHIRYWLNWVSRNVVCMGSLWALNIWEEVVDDATIPPVFRQANEDPLTGGSAVRLVKKLMGHEIEDIDDHLYRIWAHIAMLHQATGFILPLVKLDLSFWPSDGEYFDDPKIIQSGCA